MGQSSEAAKGALGGAATGAAIGSVGGPIGTGIGAGAGALIGGLSGWFGADEGIKTDPANSTLENGEQIRGSLWGGLDAVRNRQDPRAGRTVLGQAAQYGGASVNGQPQAQFRGQQMALANRLAGVASGQQMGAGEMAVKRQANRAAAQQQAMARMGRGSNAALAARSAARNVADIGTSAAGQAQQAALQDQQAANAQLAGVLNSGRSGDLSMAIEQARMRQQAGLANMDAQNQFSLTQGQMDQSRNLANMQAALQARGMNDQAALQYLSQLTGMDMAEMQARLQQEQMRETGNANATGFGTDLMQVGGQIAAAKFGGGMG